MIAEPEQMIALWAQQEQVAAPQPGPNPHLTANLVARLVLCPVAVLLSWVPLRVLWRKGEFTACVMTINNCVLIFYTLVNAAVWHDQDIASWWDGHGWCDLQTYTVFPMTTVFCACVCAIMRRLALTIGQMRTTTQSAREKRSQILAEALIIFPVPLIQVAMTYLVQLIRYTVMPVNGCGRAYDGNVIYLLFFVLPTPIFTAAACVYAGKWLSLQAIRENLPAKRCARSDLQALQGHTQDNLRCPELGKQHGGVEKPTSQTKALHDVNVYPCALCSGSDRILGLQPNARLALADPPDPLQRPERRSVGDHCAAFIQRCDLCGDEHELDTRSCCRNHRPMVRHRCRGSHNAPQAPSGAGTRTALPKPKGGV
jgi:hypothetical protein